MKIDPSSTFLWCMRKLSFRYRKFVAQSSLVAALLSPTAQIHAQGISVHKNQITIESLLTYLRTVSDYDFFYSKELLSRTKPVNVNMANASIENILDAALANQPLTYSIKNKTIVLTEKKGQKPSLTPQVLQQQNRRLTGVVRGSDETPLANVTVNVKNTSKSTATNENGQFSIEVDPGETSLIVSSVGYKKKEVKITSSNIYNITLDSEDRELDQVVVTGVFSRPESNFTGSATTMKGEDLLKVSSTNVFKAVSALDPSFKIIANNAFGSDINKVPEIQLRGQNSFPNLSGELSENPTQPLFILDGFEVDIERIMDLDMNLISNIILLKDASATSIYGSRGANGVMVITTHRPAPGKLNVTVTNDFSISTPDLSVYNLLNAEEKLDLESRAGVYSSNDPADEQYLQQVYNRRLIAAKGGINTDWLRLPVQTGINNRTTVYAQGGDDNIRYGVHGTANFQNGVMKGQDRTNYSGQFDLQYNKSKFRISNSIRVYETKKNESNYGSFSEYANMNPYWNPYGTDGKVVKEVDSYTLPSGGTEFFTNPLYNSTLNTINSGETFGVQNNTQVRYNILPSLYVESNFSINKETGSQDVFLPAEHTDFNNISDPKQRGSYTATTSDMVKYESLTTANYNKRFGKNLLFATLGFNIASESYDDYSVKVLGFAFDKLDNLLFGTQYAANSKPSGSESKINRIGTVLNFNYSYDDRYLIDLSGRRDGSSQYGTSRRFGNFWSVGAGWNLHNESFLKDNDNINRLKLRASYGSTGSLNIPAYSAQTRYLLSTEYLYDGNLGAELENLGNTLLSWQQSLKLNIGADIDLFKERLNVRLEYYNENTDNTITPTSLALSTGFYSFQENLGKINNRGYEVNFRYKVKENKDNGLIWTVFASAAQNKNKLVEISNSLRAQNEKNNEEDQRVPNILFKEGQSINTIFAVRSLGIDPATGYELFLRSDGTKTTEWSVNDKVAVGVTDPKWIGTFGTNFLYKGFDVNVYFDYQYGGQLYNTTLAEKVENIDVTYNVDRRAYDMGWKAAGDISEFKRVTKLKDYYKTSATSRFVQDNNRLNLTTLQIGYTFMNQAFMKRLGVNSFKVSASTNDLFTASSIKIERGTDNPFARTYLLSLRANF